jgi:hypothetical protein
MQDLPCSITYADSNSRKILSMGLDFVHLDLPQLNTYSGEIIKAGEAAVHGKLFSPFNERSIIKLNTNHL